MDDKIILLSLIFEFLAFIAGLQLLQFTFMAFKIEKRYYFSVFQKYIIQTIIYTGCLFQFCKNSDFLSQNIVILSYFTHRKCGISSIPCDKNDRQRFKNLILLNEHLNYFQNFRHFDFYMTHTVDNSVITRKSVKS